MSRTVLLLLVLWLFPPAISADEMSDQFWAAARKGDVGAVKALLAKGVDVNTRFSYETTADSGETTALYWAARGGHVEVARVLLEQGADVNAKDTYYGSTALVPAAARGDVEIVRMLLDKGATGTDRALTSAVRRGRAEIVKLLLDKGGLKAETLSSALGAARKGGRADIAELLRKAGAALPPEVRVDPETLKTYAGNYENRWGTEFSFALKDGKLTGGNIFGRPWVLSAIDQTTFQPGEPAGVTITFQLEGGKVAGFTLKQGETNLVFFKMEGR